MVNKKSLFILGISCYYHDSSATLLKDGKIVAATQEERFTRKKHDTSFPIKAIEYCLKSQNITIKDIDYIGFYEKPFLKFERVLSQHLEMFPLSFKTFISSLPSWINEKLRVVKEIKKKLKYKKNILFIEHHLAHAASSFLVSPFKKAAILTVDGVGEWTTTAYGVGKGNKIKLIKEIKFPNSLGLLYSTITAYLGFSVNNSEYKCLHPDTPIYLADGTLKKISNLFNLNGKTKKISEDEEILNLKKPLEVYSLNKENFKFRKSKINKIYRKKANTWLYKVELKSGRKAIVTQNHKFSTVDSYGNFINDEIKNLREDLFVIIPKKINSDNIKKVHEYWAYLLAYSIAESHEFIRAEKSESEIRLGCTDKEVINDFRFIIKKLNKNFRVWKDKRRKNMLYIGTSVWKDLDFIKNKLKHDFGRFADKKDIPEFIMKNSKNVQRGFLQRLFNCDGSFVDHQIIYSSASITLINSISYLLLRFGVHSRIRKTWNKKYKKFYYKIEINGKWLKEFDKKIGFTLKRKNKLLKNYISSIDKFGKNIDFIPINDLILKNWTSFGKTKTDFYEEFGVHFWDYETDNKEYKKYPTPELINRYYKKTKFRILKRFIENDIMFDQIKKIEKINFKGYVYDVIVPKDHMFIGGYGGVLLHNTMGLSAYGDMDKKTNPYYEKLKQVIDVKEDGSYMLDMSYFVYHYADRMPSRKLCELLDGPIRKQESEITQRHKDIAAALQLVLEETLTKILNNIYKITKEKNLVISGGVALNSVYNGKILRNTKFDRVWIHPDPGDGGTSIGVVSYIYHSILGRKRNYALNHAYLGPDYSKEEIKEFLDKNRIKYSEFKDSKELIDKISKLIYNNNVIGWFQGKMEWGPRALGARSILSNPCNSKMQEILNLKVKHRERFRPFAPVVCIEDAQKYFECDKPIPEATDFMLMVYPIKKIWQKKIPAVTHVDGSGRLQTVRRFQNPLYYDLIKKFGKLSKIPILINTSFNIRGEPIVCSPYDAYKCMMGTGIDYLVMDKFLIKREDNPKDIWDSEKYAKD